VVFARWCQCEPFLGLTQVQITNSISIGWTAFAQLTAESRYTLQRVALFPLKLAHLMGRSEPPSNMFACAHPNPQPKQHLDHFSHFCTAHGTASLYFTNYNGPPFSRPNWPSHGGSGHPANTWFLWHIRAQNPNCISIGSAVFFHSSPQSVSILYNGPCLPCLKIAPSMGRSGPPSNTWFLGPTESSTANGTSIGWGIFAGLTTVTDRQTTLLSL